MFTFLLKSCKINAITFALFSFFFFLEMNNILAADGILARDSLIKFILSSYFINEN